MDLSQQLTDYKFLESIDINTFLISSKYNSDLFYLLSQFPLNILDNTTIYKHFKLSLKRLAFLSTKKDANKYIIRCRSQFKGYEYLYFIFDYHKTINCEDLLKMKAPIGLFFQKQLCHQLMKGLQWIHSFGVSHNNVQLKSVWVDSDSLVPYWVDFGLQLPINPLYFSPELAISMNQRDHDRPLLVNSFINDSQKQMANDVWGLGIIIYYIIYGVYPSINGIKIQNQESLEISKTLATLVKKSNSIEYPEPSPMSPPNIGEWKIYIDWILNPEWEKRPTMDKVVSVYESNLFLN